MNFILRHRIAIVALGNVGVLLMLFSCAVAKKHFTRPTDKALVTQFVAHKSDLNQLRDMLKADAKVRSVHEWGVVPAGQILAGSLPDAGISKDRYAEYVTLLKKAGAFSAIHDEDEFRFGVAASGFASKGYRIAFTYRETPPTNLIGSLDHFRKTTTAWETAYRKVEDNWYLWIIW